MALQDQPIPVHFGQGVDTKTDPKLVPVGQLLQLQDCVFTQINQCNKRNGYMPLPTTIVGGGNISSSPNMVATLGNELVLADSSKLYAYSASLQAWLLRGPYVPLKTQVYQLSRYFAGDHYAISAASVGNYALFSSITATVETGSAINCTVNIQDISTNTTVLSDTIVHTSAIPVEESAALLLAGTTLAVIFPVGATINTCHPTIYLASISSAGVSMGVGTAINSDNIKRSNALQAQGTTTGGVLFYSNVAGTLLTITTINATGVQVAQTTIVVTTLSQGMQLQVDISGNIWVYWVDGNSFYYAIYSPTLTPVLAKTLIVTDAVNIGVQGIEAISVYNSAPSQQTVLYSFDNIGQAPPGTNVESIYSTNKTIVTTTGSVTAPVLFLNHALLTSSPFSIAEVEYVELMYVSDSQGFMMTARVSDALIVAKILYGEVATNSQLASIPNSVIPAISLSSTSVLITTAQTYAAGLGRGQASGGPPSSPTLYFGISYITLNSIHLDLFKAAQANGDLILNGSQLWSYDGADVTEVGFYTGGYIASATAIGSGGNLSAGTYEYFTTFLWTDKIGNVIESDPSLVALVTTVANDSVQLYLNTLSTTLKPNVQILLYRSQVNGSIPQLLATILNVPTAMYVSYLDTTADNVIVDDAVLYTTGGVLQNNAPPASTALLIRGNRLYAVSDETRNEVWYTKTFVSQGGVNFSGNLLEDVNISGDQIVAIAQMDSNLVHFSPTGFSVVSGDGPGDTGQGSTLSLPQVVPADTGAVGMSSILTIPDGILVKTPKGIYLLERSLNFAYFGMAVEKYNGQNVRSTDMGNALSQIRFLCDSGLSLTYDYIFKKWSTFSNHTGVSACVWNGAYTYVRTDGAIYTEAPGYYLDNTTPYGVKIQTAQLALAGVQGFERAKQFLMLGEYANGASPLHGIQTSMAYDFSTNFIPTDPFYFSDPTPYQYRTFLPQQKCDTVTILIQEQVTGDPNEYVTFTDMTLLAGMKKGFNKIQAANGVG